MAAEIIYELGSTVHHILIYKRFELNPSGLSTMKAAETIKQV